MADPTGLHERDANMGYVIPAGYSRVTLEYSATSSLGSEIVTGFGVFNEPSEEILDAVELWWTESLKLRTSVPYTLQKIVMRSGVAVLERTVGENGILTGDPSPPNTAALVRLGSGLIGRRNRGRIYLPGVLLDGDVLSDGQIESSALTSIQGVVNYLFAALGDATTTLVILHSTVGLPTLVTAADVQPVVATQRRRLRA